MNLLNFIQSTVSMVDNRANMLPTHHIGDDHSLRPSYIRETEAFTPAIHLPNINAMRKNDYSHTCYRNTDCKYFAFSHRINALCQKSR